MPSKRFFFSSFCLIFSSICMVIFISPVVFMAFSFHSFLLLKLIDCIVFSLANLFEAVNFFWHDFLPYCWRPYRMLSILILSTD